MTGYEGRWWRKAERFSVVQDERMCLVAAGLRQGEMCLA